MKLKHRQRIDLLCDLIVRQVDMKALWPYLFINGIFNYDDCNVPNWSQDTTNPEMMTLFFHKFLTYGDFNVDIKIIFTSYCRVRNQKVIVTGNIAIITENEAELEQIKLIQELYDLFEDKCEDSIAKKLNSKIKVVYKLYLKQLFKENSENKKANNFQTIFKPLCIIKISPMDLF